jgi:hypothetical protein
MDWVSKHPRNYRSQRSPFIARTIKIDAELDAAASEGGQRLGRNFQALIAFVHEPPAEEIDLVAPASDRQTFGSDGSCARISATCASMFAGSVALARRCHWPVRAITLPPGFLGSPLTQASVGAAPSRCDSVGGSRSSPLMRNVAADFDSAAIEISGCQAGHPTGYSNSQTASDPERTSARSRLTC